MKKVLKYILAIFVILNFLIILSGNSWLYKAVAVTYLKGHTSSYIDGSKVAGIYYNEKDLERIKKYCQKDALKVAQLLLRYKGEELIKAENIEFV
tara:strand:- start:378 stop:662 length:285 start_codon:yes stop_codon:yes gene_type:complete